MPVRIAKITGIHVPNVNQQIIISNNIASVDATEKILSKG